MQRYNNYHKHTHYSNLRTLDCVSKPIDYINRAKELGQTTYFTTEHGFQGNIFEAYTLCQENNLKCVYAVEAYYVDDMYDKSSRSNYHIILVAMTEKARKEINKILSLANTDGFYYKPRIDLKCLLSLTPTDTIVTTACVAGRMFKTDWEEKFLIPLKEHFQKNLYLEVQAHVDKIQADYNKKIIAASEKYNVSLIHANDSHYIKPEDAKYRDLFLKAKGIIYEDEGGFLLDYPDAETIIQRYKEQGVLSDGQIQEALNNTLIFDTAEGITIDKEFKIPKVTQGDSNTVLKKMIVDAWKKEKQHIKPEKINEYQKAIAYEYEIIKNCGMADYFILDSIVVNKAVNEYGAVLTRSGRGSGVSFYINKLLGLTEVDRIKAPITLYPTRFMSAERILSSRSLPDIDLNFADVTPVIKASQDILGNDGIYYMVAYKPLQESSAFRLWCKANDYQISDYDDIAKDIETYSNNKVWGRVIEDSKVFRGVIESVAPSPCSFLLSNNPISEDIGLIKVGDVTCCCLDGYNCDVYKYLKNDYLTVKVYEIIDKVYKLIGRPIDDISTLVNNCDQKVWDIYANALTTTINQSDSDFAKQTLKRYCPTSLAEMSAWVAAIRPGFASLLNNFLDRQPYSTGVDDLDNLLQDSFHYLMYQESIMKYLVWLGLEEKNTYDIIKKISKKKFKEEELQELQKQLLYGWVKNVGNEKGFNETWQVVMDAAHYSFNASHSLSVAIDSLYGAYLKSHFPLEYYTVVLSMYVNDMDRTAKLIEELKYFDIALYPVKFGKSSAGYTMDKETNAIYKGIESVKFCNAQIADELMALSKNKYNSFVDLLDDIKQKTTLNSRQLQILTGLNFFSDFGKNKYLLDLIDIYDKFANCKVIAKNKLSDLGLSENVISQYAAKSTKAQYREIDNVGLIKEMSKGIENKGLSIKEQIKFELTYLEYIEYKNPNAPKDMYYVSETKFYNDKTKPYLQLYNLRTGETLKTKITQGKRFIENPFKQGNVLNVLEFQERCKSKMINGQWTKTDEKEKILAQWVVY